jgi:hypothetical protein
MATSMLSFLAVWKSANLSVPFSKVFPDIVIAVKLKNFSKLWSFGTLAQGHWGLSNEFGTGFLAEPSR